MLPIIACAILGATIVLERFNALFVLYPMRGSHAFYEKIRNLVIADRLSEAVAFCERYRSKPAAQIMKEGLMRAHQPEEIVGNGLEIAVGECMDRVKARTNFLSMIANVSTLLGLIGTILGLVQSFEAVGSANAQARSALLAQGISVAMNHTLWGLTVAVPCMVAYSILMNRTNRLKSELERTVVRTIDLIQQRHVIAAETVQRSPPHRKSA